MADSVCLTTSGHSRPLAEVVQYENGMPNIDRKALLNLVDLPPAKEAANLYPPSTVRRVARKLDTQVMYESWKKAYRKLKRDKPGNTDVWYSLQIAKMDIANGRDAETIRKNMIKK